MTHIERLKILEVNNPFASSIVSDPKDHLFPDVTSINKKVYDALIRLLRHSKLHPSMGLAALVLGEAGDGKSHLIHRLLMNRNAHTDLNYILAYIQPIEDPEQTFSYLLREIVTNLFQPIADNFPVSIIDELLAILYKNTIQNGGLKINKPSTQEQLKSVFQSNPVDLFRIVELSPGSWKTIEKTIISIYGNQCSIEFLQALIHLRDLNKRHSIMEWMKCNPIDTEEAQLTNVTSKNYLTVNAKEQAARDMIKHISNFISICQRPFLICFDRLENLDNNDKVKSFGRMIEFLVDDAKSMMPIAFCRGDLWDNVLKQKFNIHVSERLKSNQFHLEGCTYDQAFELISSRLTYAYNDPDHDLSPFNKQDLNQMLQDKMINTRNVLQKTNRLLMNLLDIKTILPISEQLMTVFRGYYKKVLNDFDRYSPERLRIRRTLELYFDVKDTPINEEMDPYIDFGFTINNDLGQKGIVLIDLNNHHKSVGASLKRGINFLKKDTTAHALYIRDERCLFPKPPRWKITNELLNQFIKNGGHAIMLNRNEAAQCYAIILMKYAIKEGDISIETPTFQYEKVNHDHFIQFIKTYVNNEPFSLMKKLTRILKLKPKKIIKPLDKYKTDMKKYGKKEIMQKIVEFLRPIPMMQAYINEVLQYLKDCGIQTEIKEIKDVIKRFNDRFIIHSSTTDTIVMIKKEWVNAQL